jgi:tetratricopeptide (TPR) repeat protein
MPKRPKQHQVEDLSINALKNVLPREWIYREKDKDYGIDGEIEIFDENDCATGIIFLVQLKATDTDDLKKQKRVQLSIESINYYTSLELPVLIVRYIDESNELYIRWSHSIDRYGSKESAKSYSFVMNDNELWIDETPSTLHSQMLKLTKSKSDNSLFPIKLYFDFSFTKLSDLNPPRLKSNLRTYLIGKEKIIEIVQDKKDSICNINITNDTLSADILGVSGCFLHSIDKVEYENIKDFIGDIFTALSISLIYFKKGFNAIEILDSIVEQAPALENIQIAVPIIQQYIAVGKADKAFEIWKNIPSNNKTELDNFQFQLLLMHTKNTKAYEDYLKEEIENTEDEVSLGVLHYNYGNLLRTNAKPLESFKNFKKALKLNPHYCKEDYIFKELGGSLFELQRYGIASKCYGYGLSIKDDTNSTALYADSLMMKGEYQLAQENFHKYFDNCKKVDFEWVLKDTILDFIINKYYISSQARSYHRAMNTYALKNIGKKPVSKNDLIDVLSIDALSPLTWYNLGDIFAREESYEDSMYGFLICALMNRTDTEAWFNSFITAWNSNNLHLIEPIIQVGYRFNKEKYIALIYDFLDALPTVTNDTLISGLYDFIETITNKENNNKNGKPTVRMFDDEKFQNIEDLVKET